MPRKLVESFIDMTLRMEVDIPSGLDSEAEKAFIISETERLLRDGLGHKLEMDGKVVQGYRVIDPKEDR